MSGFLSMVGLTVVAYVIGRRASMAPAPSRLAELERRLVELEAELSASVPELTADQSPVRQADKEYTAFHYEALADQAAQERRLDELDLRLTGIELRRHATRAARCANRQGATTGENRHG